MDYIRGILDGIAIAAIFNGAVAVLVLINPRYFFDSYPKAIQKAAPEQMTKKEKNINFIITIVICGICFIYSIASLIHTGISGFWNLFWMGYIQWSILNLGDFFVCCSKGNIRIKSSFRGQRGIRIMNSVTG